MNYKLFKPSLVNEFLDKLNEDESSFIKLYENKEEFLYQFEESDILESNIAIFSNELEEQMLYVFEIHKGNQQTADFECAKLLYENLKITPFQASNSDFWNYLHHFDMYKYIHQRWKSQGNLQTHVKRHWLMNLTSQKHLINYPLTTLWWSIHLTVDENREDKYELSEVFFSNNRFRTVSLGGMSFVRHKPAILSVLEFIKIHRKALTKNITYTVLGDEISKFVNLLGGTKPLSFFDKDWFYKKLEERFKVNQIENKNLKELEDKNKQLVEQIQKLKQKSLLPINDYDISLIDKNYIDNVFSRKNIFGVKQAKVVLNKYKNSSFEEIKNVINYIKKQFSVKNIEDQRSMGAFDILKKGLLKEPVIFFDNSDKLENDSNLTKSDTSNLKSIEDSEIDQSNIVIDKLFFCLKNSSNPNYMISNTKKIDFNYCIELKSSSSSSSSSSYLLHFYWEGKIKKTKINSSLIDKNRDQMYSNGKCNALNLIDLKFTSKKLLFGIAYIKNGVTRFKAMDAENNLIFRDDNYSLHQEGKKILYVEDYDEIKYKLLPYSIKDDLGTLVQGILGKGGDIKNNYYTDKWLLLKKFWPDLFNNQQGALFFPKS